LALPPADCKLLGKLKLLDNIPQIFTIASRVLKYGKPQYAPEAKSFSN
jgi:hypothetical protein